MQGEAVIRLGLKNLAVNRLGICQAPSGEVLPRYAQCLIDLLHSPAIIRDPDGESPA